MMSFALFMNFANGVLRSTVHVEHSSKLKGMQNLECTVHPLGISNAAIPLDATAKTISPLDLNATHIALQINVLPIPPYS